MNSDPPQLALNLILSILHYKMSHLFAKRLAGSDLSVLKRFFEGVIILEVRQLTDIPFLNDP